MPWPWAWNPEARKRRTGPRIPARECMQQGESSELPPGHSNPLSPLLTLPCSPRQPHLPPYLPQYHLSTGTFSRLLKSPGLALTSPTGAGATWAAVIKPVNAGDVRDAQVPSLANMDTGGPERRDGGQPAPAEGKPGTQQVGPESRHRGGWPSSATGGQRGASPPIVHHRGVVIGHQHVAAPGFDEVDFEA